MGLISSDPYVNENNGDVILKRILDIDEGVFRRLMDICDSKVDYETAMKVLVLMTAPRTLDKMPSPMKQEKDIGMQSGIREYFKIRYNATHGSDDEEITGILQLPGVQFRCDFGVIRTVKALVKTGRSKHEEVSVATTKMVGEIIKAITSSDYFTVKMLCNLFEPKGYYEKELVKAIKEVHGVDQCEVGED